MARPTRDPTVVAKKVLNHIVAKYDPEAIKNWEPEQSEKDSKAQAAGKLGGLKGGKARAAKLSPAKRKQIASRAAKKRWDK